MIDDGEEIIAEVRLRATGEFLGRCRLTSRERRQWVQWLPPRPVEFLGPDDVPANGICIVRSFTIELTRFVWSFARSEERFWCVIINERTDAEHLPGFKPFV